MRESEYHETLQFVQIKTVRVKNQDEGVRSQLIHS